MIKGCFLRGQITKDFGTRSIRHVRASPQRPSQKGSADGPDLRGRTDERSGSGNRTELRWYVTSSPWVHGVATAAQRLAPKEEDGRRRRHGPALRQWAIRAPDNSATALWGFKSVSDTVKPHTQPFSGRLQRQPGPASGRGGCSAS